MRYIKGRSNLSCTIFVPWDCKNHCAFCTSKQMYKQRECDMDAILAQIEKMNENPFIEEFVFTGGEPFADIKKLGILLDAVKKPAFINTTLPINDDIDDVIKFINTNDKITGLNISRHMHQQFYEDILGVQDFHRITKPIKVNIVLSKKFDIEEFKKFAEPYFKTDAVLSIRADYRFITKDNLKNRDEIFEALIKEFEYESSGGCMVCNDDVFWHEKTRIHYHRGMESSKVIYGNKAFINDVIITIDGQIYDDWNFKTNTEFERWIFGDYTLTDDVTEYENEPVFIDWLLRKNGQEGIYDITSNETTH